ncbi:phosphomevalonate kinase [Carnimonas bestiolae]|uniref:phosphomevalonate kinase n=1 Tax=Carnimonas bestiolae TaxID=3402172 RepID=UPI003EDC6CA9
MSVIEEQAPGKLYIAGEYAVIEPGNTAILVAVDRFLRVRLTASEEVGSLTSSQYGRLPVRWRRSGDHKLVLEREENPFDYVLSAIAVTEQYAREQGRELAFYHLDIDSQLDDSSGRKYGLGSSGAVTVATIKALARFYALALSPLMLFKLAALAQVDIQPNGSCGDLAASAYGGWIAYTCFDREWARRERATHTVTDMLSRDWPHLDVRRLSAPSDLHLVIGWTGAPASTPALVAMVQARKSDSATHYDDFLSNAKRCMKAMVAAFEAGDTKCIQAEIRVYRRLLHSLGKSADTRIETPELDLLCAEAEHYGGAAKTSGAGGGDCGIAIFNADNDVSALLDAWTRNGILPLSLKVHNEKRHAA